MRGEPFAFPFVFVGGVVVDDEMYLEPLERIRQHEMSTVFVRDSRKSSWSVNRPIFQIQFWTLFT